MRRVCFLLFAMMVIVPAWAQLKVGLTAGLNISQLHVADDSYKAYIDQIRPGFLVGPTVMYRIPQTGLSADVSALYDMRGAKSKNNSQTEPVYCHSFQFPLNVRYGMDYGDMVYAFVFTGPQYGFNAGSTERLIASGKGKTTGHAMERRWVANKTALSWNFGIGGVVMEKVQVRISYNLALQQTGEIRQVDLETGSSRVLTSGKAHACQIAITYLF